VGSRIYLVEASATAGAGVGAAGAGVGAAGADAGTAAVPAAAVEDSAWVRFLSFLNTVFIFVRALLSPFSFGTPGPHWPEGPPWAAELMVAKVYRRRRLCYALASCIDHPV
jgi:hypothetical protein